MDLGGGRSLLSIRFTEAVSVSPPAVSSIPPPTPPVHSGVDTSFPILVIAVIGIVATIFLLVSYYVFVIKCCLNWHRVDLLSRFSLSRRHGAAAGGNNDQLLLYSQSEEPRGLDEAVIRTIPIFQYKEKKKTKENRGKQSSGDFSFDFEEQRSYCECAVCLNEFQEDERLRIIPNCSHVFHIDCIDIWLQNNANCPLCRTSVSARPTSASAFDLGFTVPQIAATPAPSPQDPPPSVIRTDEDYVVIELGAAAGEPSSDNPAISGPSVKKSPSSSDIRFPKKGRKFAAGTSMGDELIGTRGLGLGLGLSSEDKRFEPIRRSISMDSAADRQLLLAVREILQQRREEKEQLRSLSSLSFSPIERTCSSSINGGGSSRGIRRTFFSFGHGRASRSAAVQPVCLEP